MARPEIKFTDKDKKQIKTLSGYGFTQEEIAVLIGHDADTIRKHCKKELAEGKLEAKSICIGKLFGNIKLGKEASIFFYLKTQHGWKETVDVNIEQLPRLNAKVGKLKE